MQMHVTKAVTSSDWTRRSHYRNPQLMLHHTLSMDDVCHVNCLSHVLIFHQQMSGYNEYFAANKKSFE
jgi:hypothetical protein